MQSDCPSLSVGFLQWTPAYSSNRSELVFSSNRSEVVFNGTEPPRAAYRPFSPSTMVLLALLMTLLVAATVLGNALVILCFLVEKKLRSRGNFFFLNLAIADFLVGGFCIPVYIPYVLTGEWRLGRGLCKLWLVVDYTLCTASVFNIVLISFDRFMSVTKPLSYQSQKGMSRGATLKMLSVWLAAFLLYGPAIISWEHATGHSVVPDHQCHAEFYFNWYFLMTASMFEFFTPFITVTYFNVSIYLNIRRRNLMRGDERLGDEGGTPPAGRRVSEMEELSAGGGGAGGVQRQVFFVRTVAAEARRVRIAEASGSRPGSCCVPPMAKATVAVNGGERGSAAGSEDLPPLQVGGTVENFQNVPATKLYPTEHHEPPLGAHCRRLDSRLRLSRDKKVAKSLAVIVCVFGLCWAPYTLLMIIRAACHSQCIQHYLYEISFWLLWLNSSINPVLYPLCHTSFRRAFSKLLCPIKIKVQPQYMEHNF
ncbi:histamine H3 receptor [Centroberyx gerrardi]|uniref:histamine H3 receptor n=1 Tax=Centroberyx gerrardi TaxID=166262 RepID=UPI003AAD8F73